MSISRFMLVGAAAATEPSVGVVVATGVSIVFGVLVLLFLLITLEGVIFRSIDNNKKNGKKADKPAAAPAPKNTPMRAQAAAPAVEKGIPGEIVAAIAAAVACMDGGSYTLRSVARVKKSRNSWGGAAAISYTEPF